MYVVLIYVAFFPKSETFANLFPLPNIGWPYHGTHFHSDPAFLLQKPII